MSLIVLCSLAVPVLAEQDSAVAQQDTGAQQDTVVEEIVARVNNAIITRADLRHNEEQSAQDSKQQSLTQDQIDQRQANSLRDLIDQQLLLQKAAELGISADAELVKRLDELRKQMKATSMEDLQKMAESQGISWEDFKQNTKNGILTQKVIGSEVGSRIQITKDEIQKFYDAHQSEIAQPERIRLSEILIANDPNAPKGVTLEPTTDQVAAAQAKANQIYQQLKDGAKFDEIARKESNGSTADQGGDLGYFKRNDLAKQLEDQAFALKAGEFTQPIHTRQGFIILHVDDRIEAGTPSLDRIRDQIQDQIYTLKIQPALRTYLTKLREEAYIDIKPGYTDSGASPNQTKLIYASDIGPQTKQVRGKLGMGKKKTIVIAGGDKNAPIVGSTSELGSAKAEVDAKQKAIADRKAAEDAEAAAAAEKEKISHMSPKERSKYLAAKKREAKKEARLRHQEKIKQKEAAEEQAQNQEDQAKAAKKKSKAAQAKQAPGKADESKSANGKKSDQKSGKKSAKAASDKTQEADSSAPPKKKKISWF
ncbi:MAG: peptidylprolyl isomerase [Candidatus Korobacteraceae bacterium]